MSDRLVAWLTTQVNVDAERAERLVKRYVYPPDHEFAGQPYWPSPTVRAAIRHKGDEDAAAHIDTWNPHQVLAEVEFKRKLLADFENDVTWSMDTLRDLASTVYKDRPGYEEAVNGSESDQQRPLCGEPVGTVDGEGLHIDVRCNRPAGHDGEHQGQAVWVE